MQFPVPTCKRAILASAFAPTLILFPLTGYALQTSEVPNPRQVNGGWVTDMADILSDSTEAQLNQMISELEAQQGTEIAVVTVPQTAPAASPKEFTTALFNTWGIGKQGEDNGILFLTSVGDRRVEIETGRGIEGVLPDARVGQIIETEIVPRFKGQDFDGGILAGTQALVATLNGSSATHSLPPVRDDAIPASSDPFEQLYFGILGVLAALAGVATYKISYRLLNVSSKKPTPLKSTYRARPARPTSTRPARQPSYRSPSSRSNSSSSNSSSSNSSSSSSSWLSSSSSWSSSDSSSCSSGSDFGGGSSDGGGAGGDW